MRGPRADETGCNAGVSGEETYLRAQFLRLKSRGGAARTAILAVADSILTAANHMLRDGPLYQDLGLRVEVREAA